MAIGLIGFVMGALAAAGRRFSAELADLLDKRVLVKTVHGKSYEGKVLGLDSSTLSICLEDVRDDGGVYPRVFIHGNIVSEIFLQGKPFNLRGLAAELEKRFPNMVRLFDEAKVIVVMDRVRVSEGGVIEGVGPVADRVREVYESFVARMKAERKG